MRVFVLFILALALYLLANQTQVGWLYLMSNSLIGLLVVDYFYGRRLLKGVRFARSFQSPRSPSAKLDQARDPLLETVDFFEDDPIVVTLQAEQSGLRPAFLIAGQEKCPFAPPAEQNQSLFIPRLFRGRPVKVSYQTGCDRRGFYSFDALTLRSKGAFGLFRSRYTLTVPGELLIYPQFYPLKRLRLLEHRGFTDRQSLRVGQGSDIIGTREYRSGDSMRHIHWRSTARLGSLVVKELSDQDQLTLTVVLDLSVDGQVNEGKFSTFEIAVRLAATFGHYADHHNIPFRLVGHSPRWRPPATPLSWWGTLNYLAKVENDGVEPLHEVLHSLPRLPFVIILISRPNAAISQAVSRLQQHNMRILAIFITPDGHKPATLPSSGPTLTIHTVSPLTWSNLMEDL
ncbi:MAG: DUF58 domain-containing protein [Anaerolineae bacterium]|nr:DUF58 domain-containing protein [Anaerolineae bacterium]